MSTKAQAILAEIQALPPAELHELCREVNRLTEKSQQSVSVPTPVSDEEFAAALDEVTNGTVGGSALERLLNDRRRDRERDEARLEAHRRNRARG